MSYPISVDFKKTFRLRERALKASGIKYEVITDDKGNIDLEIYRELGSYSPHEQDVIKFVVNPFSVFKVLSGLDNGPAKEMVDALKTIYLDGDGSWG